MDRPPHPASDAQRFEKRKRIVKHTERHMSFLEKSRFNFPELVPTKELAASLYDKLCSYAYD